MNVIGLLGVAFVILKLVGVINWSWWLVLLPFYGGLALGLVLMATALSGFGAAGLVSRSKRK